MKLLLKKHLVFLLVLSGLLITSSIKGQEEADMSQYRVRFGFTVTKQPDNSRVFKAEFYASNRKNRRERTPIYEAEIQFLNILEDQEIALGTAKTNKEGIAEVTLPGNYKYLKDAEGFMNFRAYFVGTDALDEESEDLRIRDLQFQLDLVEVDSVQTITVSAYTKDSLGIDIPVSDAYVVLSVEGMLSRMVIEEDLVDAGELQVEFPKGLPGDKDGNITVFALIEDDDTFGNVVAKQTIDWGTPQAQRIPVENMLWSEVAPFWMYVVLTILLVGVWANYAYTIVNLLKIKKDGKKMAMESDD
ncbi:hypothetical protein LVD13_01775 [Flavobacteriaceae bacterium D16]|nr:hypothetical protein [Flavobacteriaceae bacterium D16]